MEKLLEASYLTTADVARRLGVQGGTVRHYGELLRARGYPFNQGENGEWLWPPEVVEVARGAYLLAKGVPGVSFERALDYLEYVGRVALSTRKGTTLPEVLQALAGLPERLGHVPSRLASALDEVVAGAGDRLDEEIGSVLSPLRDVLARMARHEHALGEKVKVFDQGLSQLGGLLSWVFLLPLLGLAVVGVFLAWGLVSGTGLPSWASILGLGGVFLGGLAVGWWVSGWLSGG